MGYGEGDFCDFWAHINRILQGSDFYANTSDADAIFPPLAYTFLSIFANILSFRVSSDVSLYQTGYGMLIFLMYIIVFVAAFIQTVHYAYKDKAQYRVLLCFVFLLSYPFWGCAFERGNPVIYAMLFLLMGIAFRESSNKVLRELALICIAISAGFKIYPAIFGILYIAEKRYKEAIRLVVYGILFFFVPFLWYGDFISYVGMFLRYTGKSVYSKTSIIGNCVMILGNQQGVIVGRILTIIWIGWVMFFVFTEKCSWKRIAMLTSTQTILLAESYVYTYVFISIPLIMFLNYLNEKQSNKLIDYVDAVLFALVFTCPPLINIQSGVLVGIYFAWLAMLFRLSAEKIVKLFGTIKTRCVSM